MKPFTSLAILFGASILAAWIAFQAFNGSSLKTHDVTHKMSNIHHAGDESVLPLIGVEARTVAPVYDASGALVSDPTGTIANTDIKIAPVYDVSGRTVSDPTSTIWNSDNP